MNKADLFGISTHKWKNLTLLHEKQVSVNTRNCEEKKEERVKWQAVPYVKL